MEVSNDFKKYIAEIIKHYENNNVTVAPYPKLKLVTDSTNASNILGRTGYYDPASKSISLFISERHPKDVLRSFAHELFHHHQNLREGGLEVYTSNVNEDKKLQELEAETYLKGNMLFRSWENGKS